MINQLLPFLIMPFFWSNTNFFYQIFLVAFSHLGIFGRADMPQYSVMEIFNKPGCVFNIFSVKGYIRARGKLFISRLTTQKTFYTHKSLNLLYLLWIQYIQWKPDIQCQLRLKFFGPIQSIIQDCNLRKRHYLIYFSVLDFVPLFFEFQFLFSLDITFSYQNHFLIFLYWKYLVLTLAGSW